MNQIEIDLLNNTDKLSFMHSLLTQHQFSEEFLIKTICYYDSWRCLRTQKNLSPEFCFKYLYDNDNDSKDDWTDYNDVKRYLLKNGYTEEQITEEFKKAMNDRDKN
jgi:hypothetical protein